jgi:hypothetical protein
MKVDRSNGLPSDTVYYAMRDREGALWLGQDAGVARVEIPSPITYFNQSDGLSGGVQTASRIDGRLLVGLQSGAAYLAPGSPDGKTPPHFENILGTGTQCWWFTKMVDPANKDRSAILLACGDGLNEVVGNSVRPIKAPADLSFRPNVLLVSKHDRRGSGRDCSTGSVVPLGRRQVDRRGPGGGAREVRSLFEDANGTLWMGTSNDGVLRLTLGETPRRAATGDTVDHSRKGRASQGRRPNHRRRRRGDLQRWPGGPACHAVRCIDRPVPPRYRVR